MWLDSPVSNDGCGLKLADGVGDGERAAIHPSAMTGVD